MRKVWTYIFLLLWVASFSNAHAVPFYFEDIPTNPNKKPVIDISSNFLGDVSDFGPSKVLFTIANDKDGTPSAITTVYFDYTPDTLLSSGVFSTDYSVKVDKLAFAKDNNPPTAQLKRVKFTVDWAETAKKKKRKKGAGLGETAAFVFDADFEAVIAAMQNDSDGDGFNDLRIAMRVQSIPLDNGKNARDSYVSLPPEVPVPEPGTLIVYVFGLIGLGFTRRKSKK
jgi:hypothetical protein